VVHASRKGGGVDEHAWHALFSSVVPAAAQVRCVNVNEGKQVITVTEKARMRI